jgi:nucleotide-binding universal stress UspA family protein
MPLKDIIVVVDDARPAAVRIDYAAGLAVRHDAHLVGLYVAGPPAIPPYILAQMPDEIRRIQRETADALAGRMRTLFEERTRLAGIAARTEWREGSGDPTTLAALMGRYADLIVVGQLDGEAVEGAAAVLPHELVMGCGRPVLVVPHSFRLTTFGERPLIAWNASREAARAVADALPILERAAAVTVLVVNPHAMGSHEPGADIAAHLARHGVAAEAAHLIAPELDPSDTLLNRVSDLGSDMLVMGAYGRSRLRELVLGGVTRAIMQRMTVPVLMAH